jgi:hypothetical protein
MGEFMDICSETQIMSKSQPAAEKEIVRFRSKNALPPIGAVSSKDCALTVTMAKSLPGP